MRSSDTTSEIIKALHAAQKEIGDVAKGGDDKFLKRKYARIEDVIGATKATLLKHGVVAIGSVESVTDIPIDGKQHRVTVKIGVRFAHLSGEWIEVDGVGEGCDTSDKSTYKAITGARKYALANALNLATTDDPEADGAGKYDPDKPATKGKANKKIGIEADATQMTAAQCRKVVIDLCRERGIPMEDISAWLRDHGAGDLAGASPSTRAELLTAIRSGHFDGGTTNG